MSDNKLNLVVQFSKIDQLSGGLKNIIGLGKSGSQALGAMKREARDLKGELASVQAAMAKGSGNITQLVNRERQLEDAIARSNRQLERQKRLLAIDGTVAKIQAQGQKLQSAGQQNMLVGASILAPFILAGKGAMDFSSGMVDIQQKANLTNRETAGMARNILRAADAAHQLPEAMRGGIDTLAGLGLDPRLAVQMIGPLGRLGTAFKVEIADGAAAAFANLNNLKVALGDTSRALDIMAAAGNAGAFEVKDMARFFPGLTAQAQALGQSGLGAVADLSAALQIARRASGTADEAGTNVQNLLAKINSPGVIRAFQKNFGVDLPAALKKAYAEGKTPMEALAEITKKATGGDLSKIGFAVEDMQAQSALRALILNMEDYRKIRDQIFQSGGTVSAAFNQRELQDASVAWKSFMGTASALGITLGSTVLPVATEFFRQVNSIMGAVSNWAQANPRAASSLISLVAGLAAARVGFGALQYVFGTIIGPMATMWGWFQKLRAIGAFAAIASRAAQAFGILRVAVMFLARGVMQAGLMMLANPVVLAIVAIVAVIGGAAYLIYKNWEPIKAFFVNMWTRIQSAFAGPMGSILTLLFPFIGIPLMIYRNWGAITGFFGTVWAGVKSATMTGVNFFASLPGRFASFGAAMIMGLVNALSPGPVIAKLLSIARGAIGAFKNFFGIKSPSRLFMEMGGHMTMGLGMGLERGGKRPLRAMARLATGVAGAGALALGGPAMASGGPSLAGPALSPGGAGASARGGDTITIKIYQQPGEDASALAERVADVLEARKRRASLSTYQDDF